MTARGRYDLLLYLLDASKTEIDGTRMSIDFYVDPQAEEPYAGEVSVGCSQMRKVTPAPPPLPHFTAISYGFPAAFLLG